jgi:hypothetical protein
MNEYAYMSCRMLYMSKVIGKQYFLLERWDICFVILAYINICVLNSMIAK